MTDKNVPSIKDWPAKDIVYRPVADLIPYARNARTHSDEQVQQIADSISEWGWTNPVLLDEHDGIIAGHGRVMAAEVLGIEEVPCITAHGWSEEKKRAYILADNKLALNAGWDIEALKFELDEIQELGFDISLIGFSDDEYQRISDDIDEMELGRMGDNEEEEKDREQDPANEDETYKFHALMEYQHREIAYECIRAAKEYYGVDTTGQALFAIMQHWKDSTEEL